MEDGTGRRWTCEYRADGRVWTSTAPGQWPVAYEYGADGTLRAVTSVFRDFEVVDGELTWLAEQIPSRTTYGHDAYGLVSSVTDPVGNAFRYGHDGFGRQTAYTDALGLSEVYEYDRDGVEDGRRWKKTLRTGEEAEYLYDPSGRLKEVLYSDGRVERYEYEPERGLMTRATSVGPDGVTAVADYGYGYDEDRRLAAMNEGVMGVGHAYEYDAARGFLAEIATPARTFTLGRDALGRESRVATGDVEVEVRAFDAAGRPLVEEVRFEGRAVLRVTSTWDAGGRLVSRGVEEAVGEPPEWVEAYRLDDGYGAQGYVSSIEAIEGQTTQVRSYIYDDLGRLVYSTDSTPDHVFEYHYDEAGNRVRSVEDGEMRCHQVGAGNRLVRVDDCVGQPLTAFTFDANGAVVEEMGGNPDKVLTYDARERMVGATVPGGTWRYEYDHRAWRVLKSGPDGVRRTFRDGRTLEESVEVSPGAPPSLALSLQVLFREDGFTPWLMCDAQVCRYVLTDHLGTPVKVYEVSASGATEAWSGLLAPFGAVVDQSGPLDQPGRFPGQWEDGETDLFFGFWRYYSTRPALFQSEDPSLRVSYGSLTHPEGGDPAAASWRAILPYAYSNLNPTAFSDPFGLRALTPCERSCLKEVNPIPPSKSDWPGFLCRIVTYLFDIGDPLPTPEDLPHDKAVQYYNCLLEKCTYGGNW